MRNAVLDENGAVINLIEGALPDLTLVPDDGTAHIGDVWDGTKFVAPAPTAPPVPHQVSRRQARQALLLAGLLDKVQPAIDGIEGATQRGLAQIYWDDSQDFEREHQMVIFMATAMGMTTTELDALFIQAATL